MKMRVRFVVYLVLGCLASSLQFGLYDCSELPALSLAAGVLTIVTALVVIDRVYFTSVSARSARARVALGAGIGILGAGAVFAFGWFTTITHMCG